MKEIYSLVYITSICRRNCRHIVFFKMDYITKQLKAISARDLRNNFHKIADDIIEYDDTVVVARPNNKNVVIISEKQYNSWRETNYLLSSEANRAALQKSIKELKAGKSKLLTPEDFKQLNHD